VYNAGLIVAGMSAMTLLAVLLEFSGCPPPDLQSAPLKLVYLAAGYAVAMGLANLLFSLGPWLEARLPAARVDSFRRWAFGSGFGLSVSLPFVALVLFLRHCR
jgi:hypothetical protein